VGVAGGQIELKGLQNITEKVLEGSALGVYPFIDAFNLPDFSLLFLPGARCLFQGFFRKLHLPGSVGREMGP